jgi:hypothetical protein
MRFGLGRTRWIVAGGLFQNILLRESMTGINFSKL